jgi:predicted transglutaminase-like cysteine proteinase
MNIDLKISQTNSHITTASVNAGGVSQNSEELKNEFQGKTASIEGRIKSGELDVAKLTSEVDDFKSAVEDLNDPAKCRDLHKALGDKLFTEKLGKMVFIAYKTGWLGDDNNILDLVSNVKNNIKDENSFKQSLVHSDPIINYYHASTILLMPGKTADNIQEASQYLNIANKNSDRENLVFTTNHQDFKDLVQGKSNLVSSSIAGIELNNKINLSNIKTVKEYTEALIKESIGKDGKPDKELFLKNLMDSSAASLSYVMEAIDNRGKQKDYWQTSEETFTKFKRTGDCEDFALYINDIAKGAFPNIKTEVVVTARDDEKTRKSNEEKGIQNPCHIVLSVKTEQNTYIFDQSRSGFIIKKNSEFNELENKMLFPGGGYNHKMVSFEPVPSQRMKFTDMRNNSYDAKSVVANSKGFSVEKYCDISPDGKQCSLKDDISEIMKNDQDASKFIELLKQEAPAVTRGIQNMEANEVLFRTKMGDIENAFMYVIKPE